MSSQDLIIGWYQTYRHSHTCPQTYSFMYAPKRNAHMHKRAHKHTCVCRHTYAPLYTHTHTHTFRHTQTCLLLPQAYLVHRSKDKSKAAAHWPSHSVIAQALLAQPLTSASPRIIIDPPNRWEGCCGLTAYHRCHRGCVPGRLVRIVAKVPRRLQGVWLSPARAGFLRTRAQSEAYR